MAEYNEAIIWSAAHGENHPHLTGEARTIAGYMPLVETLFPGITYDSITGFNQVLTGYVQPVVRKLFPEIVAKKPGSVDADKMIEVGEFLPSEGYEHQADPAWKGKLEELLEAA